MNEKERHAVEAHEDERLNTHETERVLSLGDEPYDPQPDNVQCLHQYDHIEICRQCGDAFQVIDDVPYETNHPDVRTR
jgi:hypothetical protein